MENFTKTAAQRFPGIDHQFEVPLKDKMQYQLKKTGKGLVDFAKYSYLALVMVLLLCAVVELKHIFNIDIFPGVDTPFDNAYFAGKDQIGANTL